MISNSNASNNPANGPEASGETVVESPIRTADTDLLIDTPVNVKVHSPLTTTTTTTSDDDMEVDSMEQNQPRAALLLSHESPSSAHSAVVPAVIKEEPTGPAVSTSDSSKEQLANTVEEGVTIVPQKHQCESSKQSISLTAQWNGKKLPFDIDLDSTIGELKIKLMEMTNVEPKRQKLMLVKGKLPDDSVVLSTLNLKNNQTFLMMGTPEAKVIKAPEVMPDVLNDLEEDYTPDDEAFANDAQNQKSLKNTIAKCNINIMNPLRPGKKLLVLDLDYTLIDCKALNSHMFDIMRPGLHDFLTVCYEHFDIVIWSQTSWRALEAKITTIGLLDHINYKIAFVMDISTMFSVLSQRDGKPFKHQVKALDIIWQKFPQFSASNTIHVDDLSRNFAMNPRSGLKIGAYKNGAVSRHTDKELVHLAKYLVDISKSNDFRELDHKAWKSHRKLNR